MQNNLFKKSSMERITSPEKLNDFIKVSNPTSWMILGMALAIILGLLCWGIFGSLNESVMFNGHMKEEKLYCYANGNLADQLEAGMPATITPQGSGETFEGRIVTVAEHPLSYDEATRGITSDYILSSLGLTGWNIAVVVESDAPLYEGVVYTVSVVTDTYRPIEMVFR
ncbi:MAG: hypothetical protein E7322_05480 [Clostridiales bacterium]|nr:hypothetical protein [Clostridiales bacterium]